MDKFFNPKNSKNFKSYHDDINFQNSLSESISNIEEIKLLRCNECYSIPLIYSIEKEDFKIFVINKCRCMKYNEIKPL